MRIIYSFFNSLLLIFLWFLLLWIYSFFIGGFILSIILYYFNILSFEFTLCYYLLPIICIVTFSFFDFNKIISKTKVKLMQKQL